MPVKFVSLGSLFKSIMKYFFDQNSFFDPFQKYFLNQNILNSTNIKN